MDRHSEFQSGMAQGILAGHINMNASDPSEGVAVYGSAAEEALQEQADIERSLEKSKIKSRIHIPTNDEEVKTRLRTLKEPICMFGEDAAQRRERLHNIMADKISKGEKMPEFKRFNEEYNIQIKQILTEMQHSRRTRKPDSSNSKSNNSNNSTNSLRSGSASVKNHQVLKPSKIVKLDASGAPIVATASSHAARSSSHVSAGSAASGASAVSAASAAGAFGTAGNTKPDPNAVASGAAGGASKVSGQKKASRKGGKRGKKLKNSKQSGSNRVVSIRGTTGHTFRRQDGVPEGVIKQARLDILEFSMRRAEARVGTQRKRRENPMPPHMIRHRRESSINKLRGFNSQASVPGSQRPLTVCAISPPLRENDSYPCANEVLQDLEHSELNLLNSTSHANAGIAGDGTKSDEDEEMEDIDVDIEMRRDGAVRVNARDGMEMDEDVIVSNVAVGEVQIKEEPAHDVDEEMRERREKKKLQMGRKPARSKYMIAMGSKGGEISLWDVHQRCLQRWQGHTDHITGLAWQPWDFMQAAGRGAAAHNFGVAREDLLLLTASVDRTVGLWDASGALKHRFNSAATGNANIFHSERLNRIAWHPMRRHFVTASMDRSWILWDVERTAPLYVQKGHSAGVYSVDFQGDGSLLASGDLGGIIRVWDMRYGRCVMSFDQHIEGVVDLSWSCNGYVLASAAQDHLCLIWDLRRKDYYTLPAHNHSLTCVKFCYPDLKGLSKNVGVKEEVKGMKGMKDGMGGMEGMGGFDGSYDSEWLMTAGMDKCVKIFNANQGTYPLCRELIGHEQQVSYADISFDGNFIVSCSYDKTWKLWSTDEYIYEGDDFEMKMKAMKGDF